MKSRNLAIIFVDIAGFTERTHSQSRTESDAWLKEFDRLLMPLVKAFGGKRVKTIGDAYLCSFVSPTDALLFGMASQDAVYEYNLNTEESGRFDIRISANVGEVREKRNDVFGEPVNIAARLEGITPAGEIWFTEAVYLSMTKSEIPAEHVGLEQLKGIKDPVKVYRVTRSTSYRLEGDSHPVPHREQDPAGITSYPYGGIGLQRARDKGWSFSLTSLQGRIFKAGETALNGMKSARGGFKMLARSLRAVPRAICLYVLAGMVTILLLFWLWPRGPFAEVESALDEGRTQYALSLMENHPNREKAIGKAMLAHVLLSGSPSKPVSRASKLLMAAVKQDPALLQAGRTRRDMVACLDQPNAGEVAKFIGSKLGESAVPELVEASKHKRYWLRWNSIRLLQRLGELDEVDMGYAYILDLSYAGSCSTRKRAAKKLAELKDERALKHLHEAKKRNFLENLCMGDTLEESIREIKK